MSWIRPLTTIGTILGAVVIVFGLVVFVSGGALSGLLIAVAIAIVGPGEDLLQAWVRRRAPTTEIGEIHATIVDRATSIAFLVLLGWVVAIASRQGL